MKHEFTFAEVSKIFAQVVKIEEAVKKQQELEAQYSDAEVEFDKEFEKCGWTFRNAPKELHEMFEIKSELMKLRDNTGRKAYRLIKEFMELTGESGEWYDEQIKHYLKGRYYWQAPKLVDYIKCIAKKTAKKVKF